MKKLNGLYKRSPAVFSVVACAVILAVITVIYLLIGLLPLNARKFDITPQKIFTLSDTTKDILKGVDETVEITLVTENGIPDSTTVDKVIARYVAESKHIVVNMKYADEVSASYGDLTPGSAIIKSGKRETVVRSADYYDVSDEYYSYSLNEYYTLASMYDLGTYPEFMNAGYGEYLGLFDLARYEKTLTTAIDYVTKDKVAVIYSVTDHGAAYIESHLLSDLRDNYTQVRYGKLTSGISANADVIVLNNPTTDITEEEFSALSQYMSNGGKLALSTSYDTVKDLSVLMRLCSEYGLSATGGLVLEDDGDHNHGEIYILKPTLIKDTVTSGSTIKDGSIVFTGGTGIAIGEKAGITSSVFLKTSDKAYLKDVETASDSAFDPQTDTRACYALGVTAKNQNGGALMWVSSYALTEVTHDTLSGMTNSSVFISALCSMSGAEAQLDIAAVSMLSDGIDAPPAAFALGMTLAIILPCASVAVGVAVTIKRRKKKYKFDLD